MPLPEQPPPQAPRPDPPPSRVRALLGMPQIPASLAAYSTLPGFRFAQAGAAEMTPLLPPEQALEAAVGDEFATGSPAVEKIARSGAGAIEEPAAAQAADAGRPDFHAPAARSAPQDLPAAEVVTGRPTRSSIPAAVTETAAGSPPAPLPDPLPAQRAPSGPSPVQGPQTGLPAGEPGPAAETEPQSKAVDLLHRQSVGLENRPVVGLPRQLPGRPDEQTASPLPAAPPAAPQRRGLVERPDAELQPPGPPSHGSQDEDRPAVETRLQIPGISQEPAAFLPLAAPPEQEKKRQRRQLAEKPAEKTRPQLLQIKEALIKGAVLTGQQPASAETRFSQRAARPLETEKSQSQTRPAVPAVPAVPARAGKAPENDRRVNEDIDRLRQAVEHLTARVAAKPPAEAKQTQPAEPPPAPPPQQPLVIVNQVPAPASKPRAYWERRGLRRIMMGRLR